MYLYGIFIGSKFKMLAGGAQLKQAIQLVRDAGHGEIKRLKNDPSNSGGYDAPTFAICSDPVYVLAENAVTKDTVDVGIPVQVRTLRHDLLHGQYCMITGYSKRGNGKLILQPVKATSTGWVAYHKDYNYRIELPMSWCKSLAGIRAWEIL